MTLSEFIRIKHIELESFQTRCEDNVSPTEEFLYDYLDYEFNKPDFRYPSGALYGHNRPDVLPNPTSD